MVNHRSYLSFGNVAYPSDRERSSAPLALESSQDFECVGVLSFPGWIVPVCFVHVVGQGAVRCTVIRTGVTASFHTNIVL